MKDFITNRDNLSDSDITEEVLRVKLLIMNSNNEILLGYSNHEYQFPGGHVEENESLKEACIRELKEETGIELDIDNDYFARSIGYFKDWPSVSKNRKTINYYYEIKTDLKPNLDNTNYTQSEKDGNFELRYINLDRVEEELNDNVSKYGDNKGIVREMLAIFKIYKEK